MNGYLVSRALPLILLGSLVAFYHPDGNGEKGINQSAPPGIGGNGPWNFHNVELLSRLPLADIGSGGLSNVLGNDCWGWTDPQDGTEYAIFGLTNATSFIDISDPRDPKYLGVLPSETGNSAWRDMKVYNNHCFIVSDANDAHGMQVFDLTGLRTADRNNPTTFSNTAWYGGVESSHNIAINEDTGYAYIVGSNQASGGLHVVDISNPLAPVAAGDFAADGYTHDVQVVSYNGPDPDYQGKEIAFCCNEDTVTIVDVTNKSNMTEISRNQYAEDEYTHQGWLSEDQRYFYMGDELDERNQGGLTRLHIFDCQNLQNVNYLGYHSGNTNAIDHNLYVKDDLIYSGSYSAGLRVLKTTHGGSQMQEIAFFDSFNTNTGANFSGVWSVFPYYDSGTVLISDRQNGMFLVRLSPVEFQYTTPRPDVVHSGGGWQFDVNALPFYGAPVPGTGTLHVDRGNGYEEFPLNEVSPNQYQAIFPATHCGSQIKYYLSVEAADGTTVCSPSNAPFGHYTAFSGYAFLSQFNDNFELDQGWTVSGDAGAGSWERGVPAGDGTRSDPTSDADGSGQCYLTENGAGNTDIDDGTTILTSPLFDATSPSASDAVLTYYRWFSNDLGGAPNQDVMTVEISNDNGGTWAQIEQVGPVGNEISGTWFRKAFRINDFLTPTNQMRVRFSAADLNNGSVVEAGVDGVKVEMVDCYQTTFIEGRKFLDGIEFNGQLSDTGETDEVYYQLAPNPTSNPIKQKIDLLIQTTSPSPAPAEVRLKLVSRMQGGPAGDVIQRIEMLNYQTNTWVEADNRVATNGIDIVDIAPPGNSSDFVQVLTNEMTARVIWSSESFSGPPFFWLVDVDQLTWQVNPTSNRMSGPPGQSEKPGKPGGKTDERKKNGRTPVISKTRRGR